jgi:NAD+ diphosphatase
MWLRNYFAFSDVDRVGHFRRNAAWLGERIVHPTSRFVPVWRDRNLFHAGAEPPRAALLLPHEIRSGAGETILLGADGTSAYFAIDLSAHDDPMALIDQNETLEFADLRGLGPQLDRSHASLLAFARGMVFWHSRHLFCGICGHATVSIDAGHVRRCTNPSCATSHFPRTDPAVIMLVTDGDRALLGRQAAWPKGQHSTLAGFVEPGESLEDAVAREVREETGVWVEDVKYHSSQPWPFPASVMLGFTATAKTTEIIVDKSELDDACWFERDYILNHPDDAEFRLPRPISIARRLIEDWLGRS